MSELSHAEKRNAEYDALLSACKSQQRSRLESKRYLETALNLSGRREELEIQAMDLCDMFGARIALRMTNGGLEANDWTQLETAL